MDGTGALVVRTLQPEVAVAIWLLVSMLLAALVLGRRHRPVGPWLVVATSLVLAAVAATLVLRVGPDAATAPGGTPGAVVEPDAGADPASGSDGAADTGPDVDQVPAPAPSPDPVGAVPAGPGTVVAVELGEWQVVASTVELRPGTVTFDVRNAGGLPHALRVRSDDDGPRREWRSELVEPGGRASLTVQLDAGTYDLDCPVEGEHGEHDALGMELRLVVHEAAAEVVPRER